MKTVKYYRKAGKRLLLLTVIMGCCSFLTGPGLWQNKKRAVIVPPAFPGLDLSKRLAGFRPLEQQAAYSITLCADVPDNERPGKVYVKKETGHVFVILEKHTGNTSNDKVQVFGFYPIRPVSSLVFKNVRCEMMDNGKRAYDACIRRQLTATEFSGLLQKAVDLTKKKYNINKYNCYDYALELFNSIPGIEKLPVTHVKFPLIFGRGGSPCGLYRDLQQLKSTGSVWASSIEFGLFKAPASTIE